MSTGFEDASYKTNMRACPSHGPYPGGCCPLCGWSIADAPTPKAQEGEWTLTAPDGRTWKAASPLACCGLEQRERVPAVIGLARIMREVNLNKESEMSEQLWCYHVPGPDDLWAQPSKEAAEAGAAAHNDFVRKSKMSEQFGVPEESLFARVIEWPWSAESHADALLDPDVAVPLPGTPAAIGIDERKCDHETLASCNADGWCLLCGTQVVL